MFIRRSRILNLDRYLEPFEASRFHVVHDLDDASQARLSSLGFPEKPANGDTILPAIKGKVSKFNAEGRWVVHRDQPKERRFVRSVFWQWKTWNGDEYSDIKDVFRDCYPRTLVPPPSVQVSYRELGSCRIIASPLLTKHAGHRVQNKHVINLFLELFGSCTLVGEDMAVPEFPLARRVNWRFLPPGAYPWERVEKHIKDMVPETAAGTREIAKDRSKTIMDYVPDEVYTGAGGYADYLGYVFKSRGLTVLDSIRRDNALYVFGQNWERCSQLTKAEVISGRMHQKRIVHSDGWKGRFADVMRQAKAA